MNKNKIANPTKFYQHPKDILKEHSLSDVDKIKLLENWLDDIKLKLIAEDENMGATVSNPVNYIYIREINNLLSELKEVDSPDTSS
jgi:hypothetical protein